jgi:hypothetical protein
MHPHFKCPLVIPATLTTVQKEAVKEIKSLEMCLKMMRHSVSHAAHGPAGICTPIPIRQFL